MSLNSDTAQDWQFLISPPVLCCLSNQFLAKGATFFVKTKKELVGIKQHTLQPVYEEVKKTEIHVDSQNYNCAYFHLLYKFLNDSVNRGYNHIVPNDNELGYFQYFYFEEYGEMFCGKWHQGYNYKSIIFDKES